MIPNSLSLPPYPFHLPHRRRPGRYVPIFAQSHYTYDYNNVWIRKVVGTNSTIFIPENYQTVLQIDNGTTTHHYLWTPQNQDKLLADTTTYGILWALTDHLGSIRDIIGTADAHLIYDAFGNLISGTNPILFGYTGKFFDTDTQLQNNINRWYDSSVGRWLSIDPIGFYGNDMNLYRYVYNRANSYLDYWGLEESRSVLASSGECKIYLFVGHGWPILKSENMLLTGNETTFGDFWEKYKDDCSGITGGGSYYGTVGCWSKQNMLDGWKEGESYPGILMAKVPRTIDPIPLDMRIPKIPVTDKKLEQKQLLAKTIKAFERIWEFAKTLCQNRGCQKNLTPQLLPSDYNPSEFSRCDSIRIIMEMDNTAKKVFTSNGKKYSPLLATFTEQQILCQDGKAILSQPISPLFKELTTPKK